MSNILILSSCIGFCFLLDDTLTVSRKVKMPSCCWAPGCTSGYRSNSDKRHLFKVPSDGDRLALWKRRIPRDGNLLPKHYICDIHFEEHFVLKKYIHIINGEKVEIDRGQWDLTKDAVPTIFPNLPKYLSSKSLKSRKRKTLVIQDVEAKATATIVTTIDDEHTSSTNSKCQ
jgi:THAP domain